MLTAAFPRPRPAASIDAHAMDLVLVACPAATSFADLLERLPGTPPEEALLALDALAAGVGVAPFAAALAADARRDRAPAVIDQCALLPLPHPLDSEFRFTPACADRLAAELVRDTGPGDEILLVGTPTVALALARMAAGRRVRFVGPEGCVADAVLAAAGDAVVAGPPSPGVAAAALVDPPWYDVPMREMLASCAWGCRIGAPVYLAAPLPGARPGADADLRAYVGEARGLGLGCHGEVGEVRYATPLFELAALERVGVGRLEHWRRGTLVRLTVDGRPARGAPPPPPPPAAVELTLAGVRIRLVGAALRSEPRLVPVADDAVFPSVSSRAPGRDAANLWTSGNRAFRVDGPSGLAAMSAIAAREGLALGASATRRTPESVRLIGFDADPVLVEQLCELVARELDCARRLAGDGAWLVNARGWRS